MHAKYKITPYLANYIRYIRNKKLGYTCEKFGTIMQFSTSSWCSNVENMKGNPKTLSPLNLRNLFIIEYNCDLFVKKQSLMDDIIETEKSNGTIKKNVTLDKILRVSSRIDVTYNPRRLIPPLEIFGAEDKDLKGKNTENDKNLHYKDYKDFFSEGNFIIEQQYIPLLKNENEFYNLDTNQQQLLEDYIAKKCEQLLERCNSDEKYTEYWLYAMILMHKTIELTEESAEPMLTYIESAYKKTHRTDKVNWTLIFRELDNNNYLNNQKNYEDENVVYFKNSKESCISAHNLPIFYFKYNTRMLIGKNDHFDRKIDLALKRKLKLIDIFLLFYDIECYNKNISESERFINTCLELYYNNIDIPFNNIDIFELPEKGANDTSADFTEFFMYLYNYANKKEFGERSQAIKKLCDNLHKYKSRFLNTISLDFSDIGKISVGKDYLIRKELQKALDNFIAKYSI